MIDIETPLLGANCIDLMDFGVDQQGHTQFMYVLPFSTGKLLVELTRFGLEPITPEEAEPLLNQYIAQRFGDFQIIETEAGCIPMDSHICSGNCWCISNELLQVFICKRTRCLFMGRWNYVGWFLCSNNSVGKEFKLRDCCFLYYGFYRFNGLELFTPPTRTPRKVITIPLTR